MPPWLTIARLEEGVASLPDGASSARVEEYHRCISQRGWDDKVAWCSSFLNWCMQQAGVAGTDSALARSWLDWGVPLEIPRIGCVVVLWREERESEKGHVGLFLREDIHGVFLFGGNQLGQVREHFYPKEMILSYRWPKSF